MNTFTWNGVNCATYDIICSNGGTYGAPERDVQAIDIPGRNGPLIVDNGRFKNISVDFQCYVRKNFGDNAEAIRAWLRSAYGYRRLEDDAHPNEYRMARPVGEVEFEPMYTDKEAEMDITFDCLPQRFLKSGENTVTKSTSGGYITNPTQFEALPLIVVHGSGSGTIIVGDTVVSISEIGTSVTLDCEIMRAYNGNTARDGTISGQYPKLAPGRNYISFTGGVTSVDITPRWWTI